MPGNLLFDASSLVYALKLKKLEVLYDNYTQWLVIYEVVNALWKEASLIGTLSLGEALKLVEIFTETLEYMNILSPHPYERAILALANKLKISAYDASYIVLAREKGLILVTEDDKLKAKAKNLVRTIGLNNIP